MNISPRGFVFTFNFRLISDPFGFRSQSLMICQSRSFRAFGIVSIEMWPSNSISVIRDVVKRNNVVVLKGKQFGVRRSLKLFKCEKFFAIKYSLQIYCKNQYIQYSAHVKRILKSTNLRFLMLRGEIILCQIEYSIDRAHLIML